MATMLKSAEQKQQAGKTSPQAIRAGLHLNQKQAGQLDRIVLAGRKAMFSERSHKRMLEQLDGPGTMAQKLGEGVAGLIALLWQESRQSLPPELLIPSGMVLVAEAADFLRKGGQDVPDEDVAGGIEAMVTAIMSAVGVDADKLAEAGERAGAQPPQQAKSGMAEQEA